MGIIVGRVRILLDSCNMRAASWRSVIRECTAGVNVVTEDSIFQEGNLTLNSIGKSDHYYIVASFFCFSGSVSYFCIISSLDYQGCSIDESAKSGSSRERNDSNFFKYTHDLSLSFQ